MSVSQSGLVGGYPLALFLRFSAINSRFAALQRNPFQKVLPKTLTIADATSKLSAKIGPPQVTPIPGQSQKVQLTVPILSGSLTTHLTKPISLGPSPNPVKLVWQTALGLLPVSSPDLAIPASVQKQLAAIKNEFSVQALALDFENATFASDASVLPEGVINNKLVLREFIQLLQQHIASLRGNKSNPYILGFTYHKGDIPPPGHAGPFTPISTAYNVAPALPNETTLNLWVETDGGPANSPKDRSAAAPFSPPALEDGAIGLSGDLLVSQLISKIETSIGTNAGSIEAVGSGWTNGLTYDSGADNYTCFQISITPSGNTLTVSYDVHMKRSETKFIAKFWAALHWSRTDTVTFSVDPSTGTITGTYKAGTAYKKTDNGANTAGKALSDLTHLIGDLFNGMGDLLKVLSMHGFNVGFTLPTVHLGPEVPTPTTPGQPPTSSSIPLVLPSGNVLLPASLSFDENRVLWASVHFNS